LVGLGINLFDKNIVKLQNEKSELQKAIYSFYKSSRFTDKIAAINKQCVDHKFFLNYLKTKK